MKKLFRTGLLGALALTSFSLASLLVSGASASPAPASWASRKNKNKNENEHTQEMKKELKRKKLLLKGRHGKHKEKHT